MRNSGMESFSKRIGKALGPAKGGLHPSGIGGLGNTKAIGPVGEKAGYVSPKGGPLSPAGEGPMAAGSRPAVRRGGSKGAHKIRPGGSKAAAPVFSGGQNY